MEQPDQETTRRTSANGRGKVVRWLRCAVKWSSAGIAGLLLAVVVYAAFRFLPDRAVTYDTMEDHFKYGSTGGDRLTGIPYWIWQAMPLVCADTLQAVAGERLAPDYLDRVARYETGDDAPAKRRELSREGYKALGFMYEPDANGQERNLPIGIAQRRSLGLDRVYINCSVCHSSTVREDARQTCNRGAGNARESFQSLRFRAFSFPVREGRPAHPARPARPDPGDAKSRCRPGTDRSLPGLSDRHLGGARHGALSRVRRGVLRSPARLGTGPQ